MSRAKLDAARELIKAKQYAEARAILRTIPKDPTARKWLAKLDEIAPEKKRQRKRPAWLAGVVALVVLCGIVGLLSPRSPRERSTPTATATASAAPPLTGQPTDTPSLVAAFIPSQTPPPASMYPPSLTITMTGLPSQTSVPPEPPNGSMTLLPFDEAEYVRIITDELGEGRSVFSVRVADGPASGSDQTIIIGYITTASTGADMLIEWLGLFLAVGRTMTTYSLGAADVSLVVGDQQNNTLGIVVASVPEVLAVYNGDINREEFYTRLQVDSLTGRSLVGLSPPASQSSGCPDLSATCSQLTCAQARACFAAGNASLDADSDGIPCETICSGGGG